MILFGLGFITGGSFMYLWLWFWTGTLNMVLSLACAEGRHDACTVWFRCDCEHHGRRMPRTVNGRTGLALSDTGNGD